MAKPDVPLEESPVGGKNYPAQFKDRDWLKNELRVLLIASQLHSDNLTPVFWRLDELLAEFEVRKGG
jgi:hypothetical protein